MTDTNGADDSVRLRERIAAPREAVFDFIVDPAKLVRWMGTEAQIDPVPGGVFRINATGKDFASGHFVEVSPPDRVVFTWGWEGSEEVPPGSSTVTITLTAAGDETVVEVQHSGLPGGADDQHVHGWIHHIARLQEVAGAAGN